MVTTLPETSLTEQQLAKNNIVFARHETFHPRFGWLKKGFDAAQKDAEVFLREEASVRLGVGKNMVQSIRYWCTAFKVLDDTTRFKGKAGQQSRSDVKGLYPTELGKKLLDHNGWDPFLEDPASLWLLHWNLLKPPCAATAWYFAFNLFYQPDFFKDQLLVEVKHFRDTYATHIKDSSLEKDVTCLLKMYLQQGNRKGVLEETIDCPFTELGILQPVGTTGQFAFQVGGKENLPAEIVVAACLEFTSLIQQNVGTISINRLLFDQASPGMVFKLSEGALYDAIDRVAQSFRGVSLVVTPGMVQLTFEDDPLQMHWQLLEQYYSKRWGA